MVWDKDQLISGILAKNKVYLSKAITLVESARTEHRKMANEILEALLPHTGNSVRIGITGVPGVGKSTFIEKFGLLLIEKGFKVAVLAIDPSSSRTGGSILGDKTRMEHLSTHDKAYIRPTAAGKNLGGIAANTMDAILLCEAAGYDIVIIETVGVGQSETEVYHLTDFFLLLMLAGAGDELQGIKRGIMEMCDGMVINKADGDNIQQANVASAQYAKALHFLPRAESGWVPKVLTISAIENRGIDTVWEMISSYTEEQRTNGFFEKKRKEQRIRAFEQSLHGSVLNAIHASPVLSRKMRYFEESILNGSITPGYATARLLQGLSINWDE